MVRIAVVGLSMCLGHRIWESGWRKFRIRIRTTARAVEGKIKSGLVRLCPSMLIPQKLPKLTRPESPLAHNLLK
jgi:hypothetical protein